MQWYGTLYFKGGGGRSRYAQPRAHSQTPFPVRQTMQGGGPRALTSRRPLGAKKGVPPSTSAWIPSALTVGCYPETDFIISDTGINTRSPSRQALSRLVWWVQLPFAVPLRYILGFWSVRLGNVNSHFAAITWAELFHQYLFADFCPNHSLDDWLKDLDLH